MIMVFQFKQNSQEVLKVNRVGFAICAPKHICKQLCLCLFKNQAESNCSISCRSELSICILMKTQLYYFDTTVT